MTTTLKTCTTALLLTFAMALPAQNILRGSVTDKETGEALPSAYIIVRQTNQIAAAQADGSFEIQVSQLPPFTLTISMTGYANAEQPVTSLAAPLAIKLQQAASMTQEVVVSASRVEERILQSPVTIERLGIMQLRQSTSPVIYNEITRLKGMSYTQHSLGWVSLQPRFLGSNGNSGLLQLADGMDMTAATLGFPIGNLAGASDMDIRSVELVPGAASALYGANAFEGALLIYTKNPFVTPGLSASVKTGFTASGEGGSHPFNSAAIRWAQSFNDKFAYKINLSGMWGTEWAYHDYATDRNTKTTDRTGASDFNGLHLYGDEQEIFLPFNDPKVLNPLLDVLTPIFSAASGLPEDFIRPLLQTNISQLHPIQLTRSGYRDADLLDHNRVENLSANAALHYRFQPELELSYMFHRGSASAAFIGADKFILRDIGLQAQKVELKGKNFFVRAYTFQNKAGKSYNLSALGAYLNEAYSPSASEWGPTYAGNYAGKLMEIVFTQGVPVDQLTPAMTANAHSSARQAADVHRLLPGTSQFDEAVQTIRKTNFKDGGATFYDDSGHTHAEAMYDFSSLLGDGFSLQTGGNVRRISLFTDNTVFNEDPDGDGKSERINYYEYGGFVQASRNLLNKRLKLNGSVRYDKNEHFEGQFSPRLSVVVLTGSKQQSSLRASWQTGFQNPNAGQMFTYFPGVQTNIGNVPQNIDRYGLHKGGAWSQESYDQYIGALLGGASEDDAAQHLKIVRLNYIKPQQVTVWETGFRGVHQWKLYWDVNVFHHTYQNLFAAEEVVNIHPTTHGGQTIPAGTSWSVSSNAPEKLSADGGGIEVGYRYHAKLGVLGNYSFAKTTGDEWKVSIPRHRFNIGVNGTNVFKNFGYSFAWRWQSAFDFIAANAFGSGKVPAYGSLNAQVNYAIPAWKANVKLGGTNVLREDFQTFPGGASIGSVYYLSLTFDELAWFFF